MLFHDRGGIYLRPSYGVSMTDPYQPGSQYRQPPQPPLMPPPSPGQFTPGSTSGGVPVPYQAGYPVSGQPYALAQQSAPFGVDPLTGRPLSDKSRVVAGLLQIFLSGFAAGRFYIGHTGLAVGHLAVGWGVFWLMFCLGFLLYLPFLICWVGFMWAF